MAEEPDKPDETEKPKLSHAEQIFVRISVMQTVLAVVGIFTGSIALYAGLTEADAARKQQEAAVWPRVELGTTQWTKQSVARSEKWKGVEGPVFQVTVLNSGIGPARIAAARVTVDGEAVRDWKSAFDKLIGRSDFAFGSSTIAGRVVRPGEMVELATLTGEPAELVQDSVFDKGKGAQRVDIEICYCSVFDRCWVTHDDAKVRYSAPQYVKKCPDFEDDAFLN